MVHQMISGHSGKPGRECPLRLVVRLQSLKDFDEDFLRQVFSLGRSPRKTVAETVYLPAVNPEQRFPGLVFARKAPLQQIQIVFHTGSPRPFEHANRRRANHPGRTQQALDLPGIVPKPAKAGTSVCGAGSMTMPRERIVDARLPV